MKSPFRDTETPPIIWDLIFYIFTSFTSHILPFLHDSSLDSKLSTGHTFSDICMTLRHETMTWHDGVMRHARVAGSCHGLRDSIVTLRDWAVTSAVSAIVQLPLSAILEFTQHDDENCSQSHGPVQSFAPLLSIAVMPGLVSVRYGYGHGVMWPPIMRPV